MPKIKKKFIDEHENMEPVIFKKKSRTALVILLIIAFAIVICVSIGIMRRERERQKIDEIVNSIQNEIYLKQCNLDKMYCCGYKDKEACKKWIDANCTEENGSLEINCDIKY